MYCSSSNRRRSKIPFSRMPGRLSMEFCPFRRVDRVWGHANPAVQAPRRLGREDNFFHVRQIIARRNRAHDNEIPGRSKQPGGATVAEDLDLPETWIIGERSVQANRRRPSL